MEILTEDHDFTNVRMLAGELLYILLSLEKVVLLPQATNYLSNPKLLQEFKELDMVDLTREKAIQLLHERAQRTKEKEESAMFEGFAAKLEVLT